MGEVKIGQRNTRQRWVIQEIILSSERPLNVASIVEYSQASMPQIGQATVYRTVNALLEAGIISAVQMPGGESLYEKAHLHHHHHFKCNQCNKVYDLHGCPDNFDLVKFLPKGFAMTSHEFTFYGMCAGCAQVNL